MSDWEKLDVANLPPDILTGDYEFEYSDEKSKSWVKSIAETPREKAGNIVNITGDDPWKYRYRKRQPKPPSQEEIMTKWFLSDCGVWLKVERFDPKAKCYKYYVAGSYLKDSWFTGRQSADIPPEAEDDI